MREWMLLRNHGLVLTYIGNNPDSTGLEIARAVGITEGAVRKIVADLQSDRYVSLEKVGRRNRYRIDATQPMRYLGEQAVTVGDLLRMLGRNNKRR